MNLSENKPKKKNLLRKIIVGLFVLVLISGTGLAIAAKIWYDSNLRAVSSSTTVATVDIPLGSTTLEIANLLEQEKLIRSSTAFTTYVKLHKNKVSLRAGTYSISPSMSARQIIDLLNSGKEDSSLFTIIPGMRLDQVRKKMIEGGFTETAVDAALQASNYTGHPALAYKPADKSLEGYLFPESYSKTASTTAADIVRLALDQMAKHLTADRIAAYQKNNLSVQQAVTLASIIEKEVSPPEDRKVVAQIFLKRLNLGMALGSDVTYEYAAAVFGGIASPELDSPYNTRKYPGLPPGPIANVDDSALEAVAHPASTDYLFFLSGDDGKTYYGKTNADHDYNIRTYCQKLCQ